MTSPGSVADSPFEREGVYGVRLAGLPGARTLLRPVEDDWPILTVVKRRLGAERVEKYVGSHRATYRLLAAGGDVTVDRPTMTVTCAMAEEHPDEVFLHPFLAMAGAVVGRWLGGEVLHGGAVVIEGGAWVVLGAREAGKSSLLAQLHVLGFPVISDDVVIIREAQVLAGPGSIDLRTGAAEFLQLGEDLGVVGTRRRWRVPLPSVSPSIPLRGFVLPVWADELAVVPMPPLRRLPWLMRCGALPGPPTQPLQFFDLGAMPMLRLERPKDLLQMRPAADALLRAVEAMS